MVGRMYLKPTVKALRYRRRAFPFSKQKIIYLQKTKDEFSGSYCEKSKTGTWSTSSLIPRREDIIPRWSQLLTPLFSREKKDHGKGKNNGHS